MNCVQCGGYISGRYIKSGDMCFCSQGCYQAYEEAYQARISHKEKMVALENEKEWTRQKEVFRRDYEAKTGREIRLSDILWHEGRERWISRDEMNAEKAAARKKLEQEIGFALEPDPEKAYWDSSTQRWGFNVLGMFHRSCSCYADLDDCRKLAKRMGKDIHDINWEKYGQTAIDGSEDTVLTDYEQVKNLLRRKVPPKYPEPHTAFNVSWDKGKKLWFCVWHSSLSGGKVTKNSWVFVQPHMIGDGVEVNPTIKDFSSSSGKDGYGKKWAENYEIYTLSPEEYNNATDLPIPGIGKAALGSGPAPKAAAKAAAPSPAGKSKAGFFPGLIVWGAAYFASGLAPRIDMLADLMSSLGDAGIWVFCVVVAFLVTTLTNGSKRRRFLVSVLMFITLVSLGTNLCGVDATYGLSQIKDLFWRAVNASKL